MEKIKDVEEILKEKTKAFECGDKTVEITEYSLCDQDDMIGTNRAEASDDESKDSKEVRELLYKIMCDV